MLLLVDEIVGPIIAGVALAAIVGLGTFIVKVLSSLKRVNEDVARHVLPHFVPPSPEEIRAGAPDYTMPHQVARLAEEATQVRHDLVTHMADEAARLAVMDAEHQADVADRNARQASLEGRLDAGDARMGRMEHQIDHIETKLDQALTGLAAGNPEIRPQPSE